MCTCNLCIWTLGAIIHAWYSEKRFIHFLKVSPGVHTQVEQKWPLVCHLLALVLHSIHRSLKECDTSCTLLPGLFTLPVRLSEDLKCFHYHQVSSLSSRKGVKEVYTAMVKDPFRKWDRVDTFCTLPVDLGISTFMQISAEAVEHWPPFLL